MLIEESSPFDQALAHPFLGEPISKRLNVLSLFSMRKEGHSESFVDPSDDFDLSYRGDSHRESKQRSAKYEPPKKSKIHEITFSHDPGEIEDSSSGSFALMALEEGRCVATEGDFAIIQERHESIADIKTSMKQIHQIQKDLAMYVESQDSTIQHLEYMAIDTLDSTSSGLTYLLKMQKEAAHASKRRKHFLAGASAAVFIVSTVHWFVSITQHNHSGENGESGH